MNIVVATDGSDVAIDTHADRWICYALTLKSPLSWSFRRRLTLRMTLEASKVQ